MFEPTTLDISDPQIYRGIHGTVVTEEAYPETWMPAWLMHRLPMTYGEAGEGVLARADLPALA